jgi:hypothetical protein
MKCPKCGEEEFGDKIIVGAWEADDDFVWRECTCDCGFEWREIFQFAFNETCDSNCTKLDENGNEIKE